MDYSSPPFSTLWAWTQTCWLLHQLLCHIHARICPCGGMPLLCGGPVFSLTQILLNFFLPPPHFPTSGLFPECTGSRVASVSSLTSSNTKQRLQCLRWCILCSMLVTIDGIPYSHHYFDHQYDIALGVTVDSYLLFKHHHGGPSATPILIQNFNLLL